MRRTAMATAGLTFVAGGIFVTAGQDAAAETGRPSSTTATAATASPGWTYRKLTAPARVRVLDAASRPLATFTVGARTVTLRGATRVFAEPATTTRRVRSATWVRLLKRPFRGTVNTAWLRRALANTHPDLLAKAAQYVAGAPTLRAGDGSVVADDAAYGPVLPDGSRAEGSDFNDYLGVAWHYGQTADRPEADQAGAMDCSGFVRMIFGYRSRFPMTIHPDRTRLPRRAVQMLSSAPGVVTIRGGGTRPASTRKLAPGDLLFFDSSTDDGTLVDHVGIYLGVDTSGAPRFVSSRKTANGPTLGDVGGKSVLSGTGYYATAWRAARRL
jgi:cell wall-associated NlpC family hydrolase